MQASGVRTASFIAYVCAHSRVHTSTSEMNDYTTVCFATLTRRRVVTGVPQILGGGRFFDAEGNRQGPWVQVHSAHSLLTPQVTGRRLNSTPLQASRHKWMAVCTEARVNLR